jgi:hypothetical protein
MMSKVTPEQSKSEQLPPAQLEQLVLDYTLRKHCERTKTVNTNFRVVDTDEDGIITHEQLYVLV